MPGGGNGLILDIVPKFNDPDAEYVSRPPFPAFLESQHSLSLPPPPLPLPPLSVSANITILMLSQEVNRLFVAFLSLTFGLFLLNISGKSLVMSVTLPSNSVLVQFF
jgi:hypothetical protein